MGGGFISPPKSLQFKFMTHIFDKFGTRRKLTDLAAAEHLEKLKHTSGRNPWPVIDEVIRLWTTKNPTKWQSYLIYLKDIKSTRKETTVGNKRFRGVTRADKKNNAMLSYTLDFPVPIELMIRCIYTAEELPMNKEFFKEFGSRYPLFKIRERV